MRKVTNAPRASMNAAQRARFSRPETQHEQIVGYRLDHTDQAVKAATQRYIEQEGSAEHPRVTPTHARY